MMRNDLVREKIKDTHTHQFPRQYTSHKGMIMLFINLVIGNR